MKKQLKDSLNSIFEEEKISNAESPTMFLPNKKKKQTIRKWLPSLIGVALFLGVISWGFLQFQDEQLHNTEPADLIEQAPQPVLENVKEMEYIDEIEHLKALLQGQEDQMRYYVETIEQLTATLSDEEMLAFAKSQIQYSLKAGQQVIPSNGEIAVDTDTLEVYISQNVLGFEFLQAEWIEAGMLTGNYEDHILAIKTTSGEIEPWGADGTTVTAVGYKVSNLQS